MGTEDNRANTWRLLCSDLAMQTNARRALTMGEEPIIIPTRVFDNAYRVICLDILKDPIRAVALLLSLDSDSQASLASVLVGVPIVPADPRTMRYYLQSPMEVEPAPTEEEKKSWMGFIYIT